MYAINSLPVFLTLPLAFYIHSRTCIESLMLGAPASGVGTQALHPTHYAESEDLAQFISLTFPEKLKIIDMSPTNFQVTGISRAMHAFYEHHASAQGLVTTILYHVFITLFTTLIFRKTLVGILVKILAKRTKQTIMLVPSIPSLIREKFKNKVIVLVSDDSESGSSDEEFVECKSNLLFAKVVDREESIAKTNEAEEKFVQTRLVLPFDRTTDPEAVINRVLVSANTSNAFLTSTPRDTMKNFTFDESLLEECTYRTVPPKLKKFLTRKHDESMRLGISIEDDGYFNDLDAEDDEENDEENFDKKIQCFDLSFAEGIKDSIWSKVNIFN